VRSCSWQAWAERYVIRLLQQAWLWGWHWRAYSCVSLVPAAGCGTYKPGLLSLGIMPFCKLSRFLTHSENGFCELLSQIVCIFLGFLEQHNCGPKARKEPRRLSNVLIPSSIVFNHILYYKYISIQDNVSMLWRNKASAYFLQ